MINNAQEAAIAAARARSQQDKTNPFLINVHDGRLIPNVPKLRGHKDYRVFTGDHKRASKEDRMRWLETGGSAPNARGVVDSTPFDLGKATADEIVAFAASEYGLMLNPESNLHTLRAAMRKAAIEHGTMVMTSKMANKTAEDLT